MNGGPPWWESTRPHPYTRVIPEERMPEYTEAEGFEAWQKAWRKALGSDTDAPTWTQRVTYTDYPDHLKETPVVPSKLVAQILPWIIRTLVPIAVAWVVSWLPVWLNITPDQLSVAISAAVAFGLALVVRALEVYVDPKWGVLLGYASPAVYQKGAPPA